MPLHAYAYYKARLSQAPTKSSNKNHPSLFFHFFVSVMESRDSEKKDKCSNVTESNYFDVDEDAETVETIASSALGCCLLRLFLSASQYSRP